MKKILIAALLFGLLGWTAEAKTIKILYWNIQNGMWSDQGNNYDNFVAFVKELDPDICVWAEAESRYRTDTADKMAGCEEAYLPYNWDLLAARYGHSYSVLAGKRDTFPQVVTSKFPLKTTKRINGNGEDIIVVHGAGIVDVSLPKGKTLHLVTLHTWPQKYAYLAEDQKADAAAQGGDVFRAVEMKYICEESILEQDPEGKGLWLMLGDFNALSRVDNATYGRAEDDKAFLTHDYVRNNTPYIDLFEKWYDGRFEPSTLSGRRIDFMYMTPSLYKAVSEARVLREGFAKNWRDPRKLHGFCHHSDHNPLYVEIKL